jgi:Fe-S-cluster containining protein
MKKLKPANTDSQVAMLMLDTCYLHLEFKTRSGDWSINLPFLCTKCGVCCTLNDFLTAGPVKTKPQEHPEIHAKLKALYDELGELFGKSEDKYDEHIIHTTCPFVKNKICSIYEIRPEGCRQFPNTPFGMLSEDCEALDRFKTQYIALKRGRKTKEIFQSTLESIKPTKFTQEQYQKCLSQLEKAGITDSELRLFQILNGQKVCKKRKQEIFS